MSPLPPEPTTEHTSNTQGVKKVSDLSSLPAPSSKLLPPAGPKSSDATLFRMVSVFVCRAHTTHRRTFELAD